MKKLFTLVLALVLAFGLSVPAMAFTGDDSADDGIPFDLSIYLVEYDDNDLFGFVTLPESDRGYAKNEIVAAVVELYVPKGEDPSDDYGIIEFGGDNVSLDVTDNNAGVLRAAGLVASTDAFTLNTDGDKLTRNAATNGLSDDDSNKTYRWLFFAKVTDDDASLYAKLVDGDGSVGFSDESIIPEGFDEILTVTLDGVLYNIYFADWGDDGFVYVITWDDGGLNGITIYADEDYKSTGMAIYYAGGAGDYSLGVNTSGELGILDRDNPAKVLTSGDEYDEVMDIYEDVVVDVFGMDYFNIGNYVRQSFFEDLVSVDTLIATVDIEPWTAYVTVPDNIVVDPPKTGDAASIIGFVMVALSGAGAVALKKRG